MNNESSIESSEPEIVRHIKFYLFISIQFPSVSISIYILYKFYYSSKIRCRLNNHSIILLVLISLIEVTIDLSITLQFLSSGDVKPKRDSFCLFWIWFNFSLQTTNLVLMSWTCLQRHILIFHTNLIKTFTGRLIWHYIPLSICITYIPLFYFICVILYPCENLFDYSSLLCGTICYNNVNWLSSFDWISNMLIPSLIIPLSSIILLFRVLIQLKKMKRLFKWKLTRDLTIQLLIISILYSLLWFPLSLVSLIRIYFNQTFIQDITFYYLYYTPYLVQLLIPFICFVSLAKLWKRNNRIHIVFYQKKFV